MNTELSAIALRRIDAACDKFESEWRDGRQPRIEDYLPLCGFEERLNLLESLQKLQQELILTQMRSGVRGDVSAPSQNPDKIPPKAMQAGNAPQPNCESPSKALPQSIGPGQDVPPLVEPGASQTLIGESDAAIRDQDRAQVILRVVAGPHKGLQFSYCEHNTLLVGRSVQAQLRLKEDLHFSRHHLRLEMNPPSCFVMDLASRSGTFVNGERITEGFLKDGDVLSGGRTKIVVVIRDFSPPENLPERQQVAVPPSPEQPKAQRSKAVAASSCERVVTANPQGKPVEANEAGRINGYQLHEQIGAGDMGTMFRATRLLTREECALKVISPAARADEKSIQIFLREASILNQLEHQYIVRMIEMGASGSDLFLSTEYISVIPWERLSANWPLAQRTRIACGIMAQILSALDHAHARSMVHRDVKPGNILISRVNGKLQAKLADFGLAKHYSTAGMSQMTREGDVIGSLPFMSPEQFINSREAKPGCDLYSAGATLYWLISGKHPIQLDNRPCKFLAILEDSPVPILNLCPEIPHELARIIHRSLEKSLEKRFSSAAEMRQQIRKFAK